MTTMLLADNDPEFVKNRSEFLEGEGYHVVPALSLAEARKVLDRGRIDLAILDIRMEDDDDDKDVSGLALAKDPTYQSIPKIILTGFPSVQAAKDALGPALEGLPPAIDFVSKDEGDEAMLLAIRKSSEFISKWLRKTLDGIAEQLAKDYQDARRQSQMNYWASLGVAALGIVIIFVGTALTLGGILTFGIASGVSGMITEVVSYLFFKRVDTANKRMDKYHTESLQTRRFENLLASCDEFYSLEKKEACREKVIEAAKAYWFGTRQQKG